MSKRSAPFTFCFGAEGRSGSTCEKLSIGKGVGERESMNVCHEIEMKEKREKEVE